MKKKMRKFEEGGLSKAQEEWLGGADRTDPIIMARMRKAVPDEPKAAPKADTGELRDETGATSKMRRNTETGDLYSTEAPTPKAAPKAEAKSESKAESKPAPKAEPKSEMGPTKKTTVQEFKESLKKAPEMPGSYKKESTEKPKTKIEPGTFGLGKIAKNLREKAGITSYKSGGSVKSSASRRADGCAIRGKTKGRMV
jgi:outer membrane biosynthesis protein TonB